MAQSLKELSSEILGCIFMFLSRHDLRNARLVSYLWDEVAQPMLFNTIFLRVHRKSFEKMEAISGHEKLRQHVRSIEYDGKTIGDFQLLPSFEEWQTYHAGSGMGMEEDVREEFIGRFSTEELRRYYLRYCDYLQDQDYIQEGDNAEKLLAKSLQRFPNLLGVQYTVMPVSGFNRFSVPSLSSLSPLEREILAEPTAYVKDTVGRPERRFWTLLKSVWLSGQNNQLESIRGADIDLFTWNNVSESYGDYYRALPSLRQLSLYFRVHVLPTEITHVAGMIARACSLTNHVSTSAAFL